MADPYTLALTWLAARELSTAQIRGRLARRHFPPDEIDDALTRLKAGTYLDDMRVARAAARLEASVRHRGRHRVLQKVRRLGISGDLARAAVDEVFETVDEGALLDAAIERRLRRQPVDADDRRATARLVRGLVAQGFSPDAVLARLQARGRVAVDD